MDTDPEEVPLSSKLQVEFDAWEEMSAETMRRFDVVEGID